MGVKVPELEAGEEDKARGAGERARNQTLGPKLTSLKGMPASSSASGRVKNCAPQSASLEDAHFCFANTCDGRFLPPPVGTHTGFLWFCTGKGERGRRRRREREKERGKKKGGGGEGGTNRATRAHRGGHERACGAQTSSTQGRACRYFSRWFLPIQSRSSHSTGSSFHSAFPSCQASFAPSATEILTGAVQRERDSAPRQAAAEILNLLKLLSSLDDPTPERRSLW
jgi:hypothetical protein